MTTSSAASSEISEEFVEFTEKYKDALAEWQNMPRMSRSDLSVHVLSLVSSEPFFGHMLRHMKIVMAEEIPTAAVGLRDTSVMMAVNPAYAASLKPSQVRGLLKHEVMHVVWKHITSRMLKPHVVDNVAGDLAINSELLEEEMGPNWLVPGRQYPNADASPMLKLITSFPKSKSKDWYFSKLMADQDVVEEITSREHNNAEGDVHDFFGKASDKERDYFEEKIKEMVKGAAAEADARASWGSFSAEARKKIREMYSKEVDWRALLKRFTGTSRRSGRSMTWSNVSNTQVHPDYGPLAPGWRRSWSSSLAVYVDQSGSVSDKELALAHGELKSLARRTNFTWFPFDTQVIEEESVVWTRTRHPTPKRVRMGGTCFQCVTDHARKNRKKFDGIIIITDGGASKPTPSRVRRCYLITPGRRLQFKPDPGDIVVQMKYPKGV